MFARFQAQIETLVFGFFVIFVELFSSSLFLRLATKVALCVALERCTALILPAFAWTTWALRVWVVHRLLSFRFQVFSIRVNCCYIRRPLLKIPQWMVTITSERAPTEHQRGTANRQTKCLQKIKIKNWSLSGDRTRDLCFSGLSPYPLGHTALMTIEKAYEGVRVGYAYGYMILCSGFVWMFQGGHGKNTLGEKRESYGQKISSDTCVVRLKYEKKVVEVKIKKSIKYEKFMRVVRKCFAFSGNAAVYVFNGDVVVTAANFQAESQNLTIVLENSFGGDSDGSEEGPQECGNTINNVITCSYSNTDGSSRDKLLAIELETKGDRDFMATELNLQAADTSILTNRLGAWASIVDGSGYTYKKGKRIELQGTKKKSGYGTGVVSKDMNAIRKYESLVEHGDPHFEILALEVTMSDKCKEGRIVVYRSPSMKDKEEIEKFYGIVDRYLKHMKKSNRFQCITYIGDPNKEGNPLAKRREAAVMATNGLKNLIGSTKTRFRSGIETQPDSCYAWFDPSIVSVSAHVSGKIHRLMDHRLIRIKYVFKGTVPKYREFKEFERTIRDDKITNKEVEAKLEEKLKEWYSKYAGLVFKKFDPGKHDIEEYPKETHIQISDAVVDAATDELYELINTTQVWMSKTIKVKLPTTVHEDSNAQEVKLGQLSALLGEFSAKIRDYPTDIGLREKFIKIEKEKCDLINQIARERLESKMKHMCEKYTKSKMSSKSLFEITGKVMAKEAFVHKEALTKKEKEDKLRKNDATFTNDDPDFGKDIDDYAKVDPERKYTLRGFCPDYKENIHPIVDTMKRLKLKKNEYFYKIYKYNLELPIYILLRLIELADYFPKAMRDSKLTFLASGRAIFSLEALTKVVEVCLSSSFNDCLQEHYRIHGDPMQMAYEPDRGTTSNNLITFSLCDIVLFKTNKPIAQTFADLVKAFNMANRSVMLKEIQLIAGAGRLCRSRFEGRVYTFDGEKRGHSYNRGVDPGSPVSVFMFKLFMNTDLSLTGLNKSLIWAAAYSDDRAPVISADDFVNGSAQFIWDESEKWAKTNAVKYHTDTDDKKKHSFIEYKKKKMKQTSEMDKLKLDDKIFTRKTTERELGLNVTTSFSNDQERKLVNKYGYRFYPELNRAKCMAYRLQYLKDWYPPTFIRQMVMSYFCGVIRFGASLYWCRSTEKELDELRFYYTMAVASILKLNAYDIVGGGCCKNMAVANDNKDYLHVLSVTDLPTVRQMAMKDSVSAVRQVSKIVPEFFSNDVVSENGDRCRMRDIMGFGNGRKRRIRKPVSRYGSVSGTLKWKNESKAVIEAGLPSELSQVVVESNALIGDVWRLACEQVEQVLKSNVYTHRKFEQFFELAKEYSMENGSINYLKTNDEYITLCRDEFKLIEVQERRLAFKTPTKSLVVNPICKVVPPVWTIPLKRLSIFSCRSLPPLVDYEHVGTEFEGVKLECCLICGYFVKPTIVMSGGRKVVLYNGHGECGTCKRKIHKKCIAGLFLKTKSFRCCLVKYHLGKDAVNMFGPAGQPTEQAPGILHSQCLVCGQELGNTVSRLMCSRDCNFGVHVDCMAVVSEIVGDNCRNESEFVCDKVVYQLKKEEVDKWNSCNATARRDLSRLVRMRGRVGSNRSSRKRRRWLNDEIECEFCGKWYSSDEKNHFEVHCTGMVGDGLTDENRAYPFSRLKRFRHLTRKVP